MVCPYCNTRVLYCTSEKDTWESLLLPLLLSLLSFLLTRPLFCFSFPSFNPPFLIPCQLLRSSDLTLSYLASSPSSSSHPPSERKSTPPIAHLRTRHSSTTHHPIVTTRGCGCDCCDRTNFSALCLSYQNSDHLEFGQFPFENRLTSMRGLAL